MLWSSRNKVSHLEISISRFWSCWLYAHSQNAIIAVDVVRCIIDSHTKLIIIHNYLIRRNYYHITFRWNYIRTECHESGRCRISIDRFKNEILLR